MELPRDGGKWINPETVATADRALAYGRPLGRRRRSDRHDTLICHGRLRHPLAIALLATLMGIPPSFTLLVATVGVMSLPPPYFRPAFRTAVAPATIAADADRECGTASRVAAYPKAKNSFVVDVHVRLKEIMPPRRG